MAERVLNICFHGIGAPGRTVDGEEAAYWISRDTFLSVLDETMTWPSVRYSFDDSNISDLDIGLEALRERGLVATFFVLAGRFGDAGSLDQDGVRGLHAHGMPIGTHGMDHIPWRGLDGGGQERELVRARTTIAEVIGGPVSEAALPLGRYDRVLLSQLRRLGYTAVHTSDRRAARAGTWLQPRFSVRHGDTAPSLRSDVLPVPPLLTRAKLGAKGAAKRWR